MCETVSSRPFSAVQKGSVVQNPLLDHLPTAEVDRQTMAAAAAMVCLGRGWNSWSLWSVVVDDGGASLRIVLCIYSYVVSTAYLNFWWSVAKIRAVKIRTTTNPYYDLHRKLLIMVINGS